MQSQSGYRVSDNDFGKARRRNPSKTYILVRRRGFRLITQSKIFIWKAINAPSTIYIMTFSLGTKKRIDSKMELNFAE